MAKKWTQTRVTDVEALKAVAHPLRARMLGALRLDGPATASDLGRRFGESSGSTSYHLRQLEKYAFVVEDDNQPSKRERRWRATADFTEVHGDDFADDRAGRAAADTLSEIQLQGAIRNNRRWRRERLTWPRAWARAGGASDMEIMLTPQAGRRLAKDIFDLLQTYDAECADNPRAKRVGVFYQLTPGEPELGVGDAP